uniref:F-box domain-containing protein n=1 Tax=Plectus sambesii TaxID=2011161 RepID=A0A914XBT3_9BILA
MEDALLKIFDRLSHEDRIRCELVCAEWRRLLLSAWRRTKALDFDTVCPYIDPTNSTVRLQILNSILEKCAGGLQSLVLGQIEVSNIIQNFSKKRELTAEFIECIAQKCPKLRSFIVRRYLIPSVEALAGLYHLPSCLEVLKIEFCRLDVYSPQEGKLAWSIFRSMFEKFTNLRAFSLQGRGSCHGHFILDADLLNYLPASMEMLEISAGQSLKVDNLNFVSGFRNLRILAAQRSHIRNEDLKTLAEYCPAIESVDLSYSRSITDFSHLAQMKKLKSLRLDGNRDYFTDCALLQIAMNCLQLTQLSLDSCARLTVESLREIGRCSLLEFLSLWGLSQVTDAVLLSITNGCGMLQYLDIKYCRKITATGLQGLLKLRNLNELFVSGITDFDEAFVEELSLVTTLTKLEAVDCKVLKIQEIEPIRFPPEIPGIAVARLDC